MNRCGSVPGLKTENVLDGEGNIADQESYTKFTNYYKEMCLRVQDLKKAYEGEIQFQDNGFKDNRRIINGDAVAEKMRQQMKTNSAVAWAEEACIPFHRNKVSDKAFKLEDISPIGPDPANPWIKPEPWKAEVP